MEKIATRDAYGRTLVAMGEENPDIVVLDADLAKSTKTIDFAKRFPERFFDMGIAEQNMIGMAAGLSLAGKVPFASSFAVFATERAYEQIRNSVCYPNLNVKICATHAGLTVGEDGASHQALEDVAVTRALPNMTVIVPADATETDKAVRAAALTRGPFYIRLGRGSVPVLYGQDYPFAIGQASVLRQGDACTVIACGVMVAAALEAAEMLHEQGMDVTVINMSTIKPLDVKAVVESVRVTGCAVTAEEHNIIGGLGSAVAEVLAEHYPVPMERVGVKDTFGESGEPQALLEKYGLTGRHIVDAVVRCVRRKKTRGNI